MSDTNEAYTPSDAFGLVRSWSRHVGFVRIQLQRLCHALELRGLRHDLSKMGDAEFPGFSRINAAARSNKFGSPEYAESMQRERETIDTHFRANRHHPEFTSMTFLDVIEMVCDWRGAGLGYDDPRPWRDSFELNMQNKGKYLAPEQRWLARQVADFIEQGDAANDQRP